jgi:uncharacterized protein (TIGR02996 family)
MIAPELQRLLQACKDEPDDDGPRLVLSDWLEEHGQTDRAEFVRLQLRLAAQEVPAGDEATSLARAHELYRRHANEWLGGLRDWAVHCTFRRGLIEVRCYVEALRARPPAVVAPEVVPWLETLVLHSGRQRNVGELIENDALTHFTALDLTDVRLTPPWLERLGASPRVAHLRRLRVSLSGSPRLAGQALARSPYLNGLRILEIPDGIGDVALEAIARSPICQGLTTLALRYTAASKGISALASARPAPPLRRLLLDCVRPGPGLLDLGPSPALDGLEELHLERADLFLAGIEALANRPDWPRLRRLLLAGNDLREPGLRALAAGRGFRALRYLCLERTGLDAGALPHLLSAPWASGLERLDLSSCHLGDAGAEVLANAPCLANLRRLDLGDCGLGATGLRALANSPHLTHLQTLDLGGNALGDGLSALADADGLPALTALDLHSTGVTKASLAQLANAPLASRLRRLNLQNNKLDGDALQALISSRLTELKDLRLTWNPVGVEGTRALANGPFRGLVRLELRNTRIGDAGVRAFLGTHGFPHMALLDIWQSGIDTEGRKALLRWPRLPHLAHLWIGYRRDDDPMFQDLARYVIPFESESD